LPDVSFQNEQFTEALIFNLTYLDNQGYMVMKVYGILSAKLYLVTFYTESSKFSSYLPIAQKMIDSFEITSAGVPIK
jgi:hypothetical protein